MKFEIEINTDEATVEELLEAIPQALYYLELPNGDKMYLDDIKVIVIEE